MEILVLGCGVSGLSCGVRLLEAGHGVRIWARALPPDTTSNAAAAVWYPYRAFPEDKVTRWGAAAYTEFARLAAVPEAGVRMAEVLDLKPAPVAHPWWVAAVVGFRHARPEELPPGYTDGYALDAPVIDTSVYLAWLRARFEALGGAIEVRAVRDPAEAFAVCPVVVNCTGLGARELVGDRDIHAGRGQVARIRANGFRRVLLDDDGPNALAYIVPRGRDIVLGGVDKDGDERLEADPETTTGILRRCAGLVEHFDAAFAASLRALAEGRGGAPPAETSPAEITSIGVGLRPVRSTVRLERERVAPDRWLLHDYGHGGAGVTLSWGCADEVVQLVEEIAGER